MASSTGIATDPTDVVIQLSQSGWSATDYFLDDDGVSVSFFNSATQPCLITFVEPVTFGTAFIGLAPQGTVSLNVLQRKQTKFTVGALYPTVRPKAVDADDSDLASQQYTIDMN